VWDLKDKSKATHTLPHSAYVYTAAFHPTAEHIVVTGETLFERRACFSPEIDRCEFAGTGFRGNAAATQRAARKDGT